MKWVLVGVLSGVLLSKPVAHGLSLEQPETLALEYREDLRALELVRSSHNLDQLEQTIQRTSAKWKPRDRRYFLDYMYAACGVLSSYAVGDQARQELLLGTLAMSVSRSGDLPLVDQVRFVELLGHDPVDINQEIWQRLRAEKAALWLATWKGVTASVDPQFNVADVPALNVETPPATRLPNGVSPDAVKDPQLRAAYEKAIAENTAKSVRYNEQYWLRQNAPAFLASAERYVIRAYSRPPKDPSELERLLAEHVNDAVARNRILEAVR